MKNFAQSLTIWGAAVLAGVAVVEKAGVLPPGSGEALSGLGQAAGLLMVVIGRWRANQPLTAGPSTP